MWICGERNPLFVGLAENGKKIFLAKINHHLMSKFVRRLIAIILHALLTVYVLTWIMQYDITGSWITFSGFISLLLLLFSSLLYI